MKAARLNKIGQLMQVEDIVEPDLRPGGVKVKVLSASVPSFTGAVMSGQLPFPLPVPYTPGPSCVGIVEDVVDDVIGFKQRQRVFCQPYYTHSTNRGMFEAILIGWCGLTPNCGKLLELWKDGSFAEKAVYPATCVTPLGDKGSGEFIALAPLSVAYGGLQRGEFRPGQSLLVNGATGNFTSIA